jgi:hypothetical protein
VELASKQRELERLGRWQDERPMPGHQYGVRLIALCIELAKRVGFHAAEFVIDSVFNALGIEMKVPSHDAIEQWTLRLGVAELNNDAFKDQEVIDAVLFVINTEGLSKDSLGKLEQSLGQWLKHVDSPGDQSDRPADGLAQGLYRFVAESVDRLRSDWPRAWLSTEILESLFGRFKQVM